MFQNEDIETLTCLGLTELQARVYLALSDLGKATIKTISKTTEIARQDIYRITTELQELSLIERIIAAPNEYSAIPIQDAINILVQRKNTETTDMLLKVNKLLEKHKTHKIAAYPQGQNLSFSLIPKKEAVILRLKKEIDATQRNVDTIVSWRRYSQGLGYLYEEFEKAVHRGVKIRSIVEHPKDVTGWPEIALKLMKKPSYKVRTIPEQPAAILSICDGKEVFISTSVDGTIGESPILWSDNTSLIRIVQDYFELMWRRSKSEDTQLQES